METEAGESQFEVGLDYSIETLSQTKTKEINRNRPPKPGLFTGRQHVSRKGTGLGSIRLVKSHMHRLQSVTISICVSVSSLVMVLKYWLPYLHPMNNVLVN